MSSPPSRRSCATRPASESDPEPAAASSTSSAARNSASLPGGNRTDSRAFGSSALGREVAIASLTPWRRTPLRIRRSKIGASSSGSHPTIRTVCANSRSTTVACNDGAASARRRSGDTGPPSRESMSEDCSASRISRAIRNPSSFVACPPTSVPTGTLVAGEPGRRVERAIPRHRAQAAAVTNERSGDPLVDVDRLVREAALVAEPAVVNVWIATRTAAGGRAGGVALVPAQPSRRAP